MAVLSPMRIAAFAFVGMLAMPLAAAPATAQDPVPGEGRVLAIVDGEEITIGDVVRSAQNLPQQYQGQIAQLLPALVDRLIDMKLIAKAGREQGLADDETVRRMVREAEQEAISQVYLQQRIEAALTEEALDDAYQQYLEENPPQPEVRARHILVEEEEAARQLIADLDAGANFAALAEAHGTDGTAQRGGDLGYFSADQMVEAFSTAAFALEAGSYTADPVETQFGWHVILVEDKRVTEQPEMAAIVNELQDSIAREVVQDTVQVLRADATIEFVEDEVAPDAEGQLPAAE